MATEEALLQFIGDTLGIDDLTLDSAMGQSRKWDSLGHVSLVMALDGEFSCAIPPDLIGELLSVSSLSSTFERMDSSRNQSVDQGQDFIWIDN